jgi:hypothetical protein
MQNQCIRYVRCQARGKRETSTAAAKWRSVYCPKCRVMPFASSKAPATPRDLPGRRPPKIEIQRKPSRNFYDARTELVARFRVSAAV